MCIFVKIYICVKVELGDNHGWKECTNYTEWCSQTTTRLDVGQLYEDIIEMSCYDIVIC